MNFNSVIAANSSKPVEAGSSASPTTLGQKDFLRLLTTQMKMQDPFDPVDNKEMLAQMAQFSSLAGLSEINDTLKLILSKVEANSQASATTSPASGPEANSAVDAATDPANT